MSGSFEKSLKALSGFYNSVATVTFPATIVQKNKIMKKLLF